MTAQTIELQGLLSKEAAENLLIAQLQECAPRSKTRAETKAKATIEHWVSI